MTTHAAGVPTVAQFQPYSGVMVGYLHPLQVTASFHHSLINLALHDLTHGKKIAGWKPIKAEAMGIPDGRNMLAQALLDSDAEWLFMVDADMGFEADSLDRLLAWADADERPIVGGLCFTKRETVEDGLNGWRFRPVPTIYMWQKHPDGKEGFTPRIHYPVDSLIRCHGTGGAFVLIHRSVIERLRDRHGETWFDRVPGPDGNMMGEDLSFFAKVAVEEIPVHVHTGVKTNHLKDIWLSDADFWQSFDAKPATQTFMVDGQVDEVSLAASTGLRVDTDADWVLVTNGTARFHPGWFDHATFAASLYGAKVVQCGRHHLVDTQWRLDHPDDWLAKAQADGVFQYAAAAVVE